MNTMSRTEILAKFKEETANGKILVGVGAGTGITAKTVSYTHLDVYKRQQYECAGEG